MTALAAVLLVAIGSAAAAPRIWPDAIAADHRASRAGDVLTVLLIENSSAEAAADSSESDAFSVQGRLTEGSRRLEVGAGASLQTGGAARTVRRGRLQAQVAARVEEVLPAGLLRVRGAQSITVNGERQRISVEGLVRPSDIGAGNVVLSSRMADARVEYDGEGWIGRSQRPGLWRRLFAFLGF